MDSSSSSYEELSFDEFRGKIVFVFISGPGYLEFPWALETAIYLQSHGALVQVIDLSKLGELYAMRLRIFSRFVPYWFRSVMRRIFLKSNTLIENVVASELNRRHILYKCYKVKPIKVYTASKLKMKNLRDLKPNLWGLIDSFSISKSFFSNLEKTIIDEKYRVNIRLLNRIKFSVQESFNISQKILKDNPGLDAVFLANGRQPVQASLVSSFRKNTVPVYLYESAGGYIFPNILIKRLGYWRTNPANSRETSSILARYKHLSLSENDSLVLTKFISNIKTREKIAFKLNYLPETIKIKNSLLTTKGRNLAFFTSSEWELSVLDMEDNEEDKISHFKNQSNAVKQIIAFLKPNDQLFIRVHPQDPGIRTKIESSWKEFESNSRVHVLDEHSQIDSYDLAKKCDLNFVWESFIGVEISLMSKEVGVLGNAVYGPNFGDSWLTSVTKLEEWMSKPKLVSEQNLVPYLIYLLKGGWAIKHSEVNEFRKVLIDGAITDVPRFKLGKNFDVILRAIS